MRWPSVCPIMPSRSPAETRLAAIAADSRRTRSSSGNTGPRQLRRRPRRDGTPRRRSRPQVEKRIRPGSAAGRQKGLALRSDFKRQLGGRAIGEAAAIGGGQRLDSSPRPRDAHRAGCRHRSGRCRGRRSCQSRPAGMHDRAPTAFGRGFEAVRIAERADRKPRRQPGEQAVEPGIAGTASFVVAVIVVVMLGAGIGADFGIERGVEPGQPPPSPATISAMTWSARMRSRSPATCNGRWRLPRCQAMRNRPARSAASISSTGSGAARTRI